MKMIKQRDFKNGSVYAFKTDDGFMIETTDTFLPYYTKDAIGRKQNQLDNTDIGSRAERWMIGVSCMSGCPVGCKFCATGQMKKWRHLSRVEITDQVLFIINANKEKFGDAKEHKINYTRMGEPFMNINAIRGSMYLIDEVVPGTHHYISTVGIRGSDFSWIEDNITLQISVHSLDEERRNELIPLGKKLMTLEELGQIRTKSNLKTTVNLTLVDEADFDINKLKEYFDPKYFFIKLSPINKNTTSEINNLGDGIIEGTNLV